MRKYNFETRNRKDIENSNIEKENDFSWIKEEYESRINEIPERHSDIDIEAVNDYRRHIETRNIHYKDKIHSKDEALQDLENLLKKYYPLTDLNDIETIEIFASYEEFKEYFSKYSYDKNIVVSQDDYHIYKNIIDSLKDENNEYSEEIVAKMVSITKSMSPYIKREDKLRFRTNIKNAKIAVDMCFYALNNKNFVQANKITNLINNFYSSYKRNENNIYINELNSYINSKLSVKKYENSYDSLLYEVYRAIELDKIEKQRIEERNKEKEKLNTLKDELMNHQNENDNSYNDDYEYSSEDIEEMRNSILP